MISLLSAFGFTDYNADHRAFKDGKVYYNASTENYKAAMKYFDEWYKEGLIDIEAFSQDDSQYIAKGSGDDARLGVFSWWEVPEVVGKHAEDYEYLTYLSGSDGTIGVNLNEQGRTGHDRFAITKACKNGVYVETAEAGGNLKAKTELWSPYRQLDSMGVKDVVGAWQSAYDRYAKEVGNK